MIIPRTPHECRKAKRAARVRPRDEYSERLDLERFDASCDRLAAWLETRREMREGRAT